MCKSCLRKQHMNAGALTADARNKFQELVRREARGPGDWLNAVRRLAREFGLPYAKLWAVLYRPPKDISASVYIAIVDAYAEQERHFTYVRNQTEATGPISTTLHRAAGAMDRLAAAISGEVDGE